jgi:hypothetical protein
MRTITAVTLIMGASVAFVAGGCGGGDSVGTKTPASNAASNSAPASDQAAGQPQQRVGRAGKGPGDSDYAVSLLIRYEGPRASGTAHVQPDAHIDTCAGDLYDGTHPASGPQTIRLFTAKPLPCPFLSHARFSGAVNGYRFVSFDVTQQYGGRVYKAYCLQGCATDSNVNDQEPTIVIRP